MGDIFDQARRAAQDEVRQERASLESAGMDQARRQVEQFNVQQRLADLHAGIPELHSLLLRAGLEPSCVEGQWVKGLRALFAGSRYPIITQINSGRRGWPLAKVRLIGRRRVVIGNFKGAVTRGWRNRPIGDHGIALLDHGEVCEYSCLEGSGIAVIGQTIDMTAGLPPQFVLDAGLSGPVPDAMDHRTTVIANWVRLLECEMKELAKACFAHLERNGNS